MQVKFCRKALPLWLGAEHCTARVGKGLGRVATSPAHALADGSQVPACNLGLCCPCLLLEPMGAAGTVQNERQLSC